MERVESNTEKEKKKHNSGTETFQLIKVQQDQEFKDLNEIAE